MVYRRCDQQTEQLHGLDGQQEYDAPHPPRRQIADGDEQQPVARIEHQYVAVIKDSVYDTQEEQEAHSPDKASGEALAFLLLVVVHNEETQPEEHGEDAVHLAREQPSQHVSHSLVARQSMGYRLLSDYVEMIYGVIQDDAGHGDTPQGIGHVNPCIWQIL